MDIPGRETVDSLGTTPEDLVAISRLLETPRLARIWFTLNVEGNIRAEEAGNPLLGDALTVAELADQLDADIPQSTLYNDINELVDVGAVRERGNGQPARYSAVFFQAEAKHVDRVDDAGIIGPAFLGLIGEAYTDEDVAQFLSDHGYNTLDAVTQIYQGSLHDDLDDDFTAMFPRIDNADLTAIEPALERVYLGLSRDPLWSYDYRDDLSVTSESTN